MQMKVVSGIALMLLLACMLTSAVDIQPAKAESVTGGHVWAADNDGDGWISAGSPDDQIGVSWEVGPDWTVYEKYLEVYVNGVLTFSEGGSGWKWVTGFTWGSTYSFGTNNEIHVWYLDKAKGYTLFKFSLPKLVTEFPIYPTPTVGIRITNPTAGSTFYIEPEPKMPTINAQAEVFGITPDLTASTEFTWTAQCSYTTKLWTPVFKDGKYADFTYTDYEFNHVLGPVTVQGGTWSTEFKDVFCGGTLIITVKAVVNGKEYQDSVIVYIKGKNPSRAIIKNTLNDPDPHPKVSNVFRQALSYTESGFLQFWDWPWQKDDPQKGFYSPYYDFSMPVYGPPGGHGLMQIDWPVDSTWNKNIYRWGQATQEEVMKNLREYQNGLMWNWLYSLQEGSTKIKETIDITKSLAKQGAVKLTQEQFERNVACVYNSGRNYFQWDVQTRQWLKIQYPVGSGGYDGQNYADIIISIENAVLSGQPPIGWYDT